ncbi:protocadherin-23-like [Salvelinus alpinus]|uniref:protocadherin-23-like n=1 Tax=Salvelinus alpinus TaxID=8036 RepID=UPI0039FBA058
MVTATDPAARAADHNFVTVAAQVFLLDVNDNCPAFISQDTALVMEDAEVGSLVHRVGNTATVHQSQLSSSPPVGLLYLASPLDYELQSSHSLTIQVSDQGLRLEVGDVNNQPPLFQQDVYTASVAENRVPGESVVTVSSTDKDSGLWMGNAVAHDRTDDGRRIEYSIFNGTENSAFTINRHTGWYCRRQTGLALS